MYIQRNYSGSLYGNRRRSKPIYILLLGIMLGGILVATATQFDSLQAQTLKAVGYVFTPTPFAGVYANEAAVQFVEGDLEGARINFEKALQQQPDNVDYLYEYGRVLIELGRSSDAVPVADRAISVAPNDVRGYALKANALAWNDPGNAVPIAYQGRNIDPDFSPIHAALAIAYNNLGRYDLAVQSGTIAIAKDPQSAEAYRAYAWPLIYTGKYHQAISTLETAISLNPNMTGSYFQLAFEYKNRMNNPQMAVAIYNKILDMNPSPEDAAKANLRICETFAGVRDSDFRMAEPYCYRAIEIKPDYGSAYRELGRMRYNRRNYEGAIEAFETCVALGATDLECWGLRGLAHYMMGECDQAYRVLNEAAERAYQLGLGATDGLVENVNIGLYNITVNCPAYSNISTQTPIVPTAIPPTPIGGL